ncbi:FecR domain-containing protein [Elusimicrobiota bacterium]
MKRLKILIDILVIVLFISPACFASVAVVSEIEGELSYRSTEMQDWASVSAGQELDTGDRLKTGDKATAIINFNAGHSAVMNENSEMVIRSAMKEKTNLDLFKGKLRSKVKKLTGEQAYIIETPQAVCAVRGTDFTVSVKKNMTKIRVYEGVVEAKELITGKKLEISAGQSSDIMKNKAPMRTSGLSPLDGLTDEELKEREEVLEAARVEMFEEISRDAVMARAAEEIKKAEYENGKAMIDVHGNRVRMEEYVVRPEDYQFKYVVLNTRDERFDFSKILFTFNKDLPDDLTLVSKNMYYSASEEKPEWILTDMISVVSNTQDQINELASNGDMIQDENDAWRHYFGLYEFYIKGYNKDQKILWTQTVTDTNGYYEDRTENTTYLGGEDPVSVFSQPDGEDTFHFRVKDTYGDDTWLTVDDYLIDDDGDVKTSKDLEGNFESSFGGSFEDYLAELNFERRYTSSEFGDRDIDIVFSTKLLLESGMLSIAYDESSE